MNTDTVRSFLLTKIRHFSYSHHVWPVLKCLSKERICNTKNDTRPKIYDAPVRPYLQFPAVGTLPKRNAIIFGYKAMLFSVNGYLGLVHATPKEFKIATSFLWLGPHENGAFQRRSLNRSEGFEYHSLEFYRGWKTV